MEWTSGRTADNGDGVKSKGTDAENRSKALMESQGYVVEKARAKVIWIKGRPISLPFDFFGCADLICAREDGFKVIQVKSTTKQGNLNEHTHLVS